MNYVLLCVSLAAHSILHAASDVQKQVVNTAWWPPGTEKKEESVGIISHGFVFMTGMMELNATFNATAQAELSDIRDIAKAGGSSLENLVDCLVNAPSGSAAKVRAAFLAALPDNVQPALTVVELNGEYGSYFPVSATCVASLPPTGAEYPRKELHVQGARGVAAGGLLHIETLGNISESLGAMGTLIRTAGGRGLADLADCTAFVRDIEDARMVRQAIHETCEGAPPVLTLVRAGLEDAHSTVALRCVASVPAGPGMHEKLERRYDTVETGRFAFVSGQYARASNATDAFASLGAQLAHVGLNLSDVVNCLFFMKNASKVDDLFSGFYEVFNKEHPPPPARNELEAASDCSNCTVVAKCIAAFPAVKVGVMI